jgi:NADPH:quinone reductase-like Zn-dependent oxidoreductase
MKAVICTQYGPPNVMSVKQVPKPVPKDNEVLIKVFAATVTAGDCLIRRSEIPILFRVPLRLILGLVNPSPGIFGQEFAGEIEHVGKNIRRFRKGQCVFGPTTMRLGAYAQYICLPEEKLTSFDPQKLSFQEAATIPTGGINGLHFVTKARITANEKVLINGAGGSIGSYAVQIAKSLGAVVTCVDSNDKLQMLLDLGADFVIDYRKQDFTQINKRYDVIIDIVGESSFSSCINILNSGGRYVLGNPSPTGMLRGMFTSMTTDKEVLFEFADYKREHLDKMKESLESKKVRAVIDKTFPLEELADAHRYVEAGLKRGNVVISIAHSNS